MSQSDTQYTQHEHTIQRRCRFCFVENSGGRICLDGRSQTTREPGSQKLETLIKLTRPTQHRGVYPIEVWDQKGRGHDDQQNVRQEEIRCPQ